MLRIQLQRVLESVHRFGILFVLRVRSAKEIPAVSIVRIDFRDMAKRINGGLRVAGILEKQPQVVPGVGIVGVLLHRLLQQRPGGIDLAQIQQRNPLIQPRNLKLRIKRGSVLKRLQAFSKSC